jgi:hypothetical protein
MLRPLSHHVVSACHTDLPLEWLLVSVKSPYLEVPLLPYSRPNAPSVGQKHYEATTRLWIRRLETELRANMTSHSGGQSRPLGPESQPSQMLPTMAVRGSYLAISKQLLPLLSAAYFNPQSDV